MSDQKYTSDSIKTIKQLEKEKEELRRLAERDWLTGVLNRGAIEREVNEHLKKKKAGTMIVFDLDNFKQVNDRYGHIVGDQLLQFIGEILKKMATRDALVGRVGGDEFAIFSPYPATSAEMDLRCARIRERFREVQLKSGLKLRMSMIIEWADAVKCRDYNEVFDLVDQKILAKKRLSQLQEDTFYAESSMELRAVNQDIRLIVKDLNEQMKDEGAYCQDYETFRRLYRLEMRRMRRKESNVYLILFTLTDKDNHFITIAKRDQEMELLGEEIRKNLRLGDVYTQYSSCQYLVMVPDVLGKYIDVIADRIREAYFRRHEGVSENLMLHRSYPLKPENEK